MASNSIQSFRNPVRHSIPSKFNTNPSSSNSLFLRFDHFPVNPKPHISITNPLKHSPLLCSANEQPEEETISYEWPENFSLLNYDDLIAYLEPELFKDKMDPSALLGEVMSTTIRTATVEQSLEEIDHHFQAVSGLPVVDDGFVCVGVVSKKDKQRASNGLKSKVGEIMSSPAVTLTPDKTVLEAAVLMLKQKFHRIPIVNEGAQIVGIVTRTDIFKALEGLPA